MSPMSGLRRSAAPWRRVKRDGEPFEEVGPETGNPEHRGPVDGESWISRGSLVRTSGVPCSSTDFTRDRYTWSFKKPFGQTRSKKTDRASLKRNPWMFEE